MINNNCETYNVKHDYATEFIGCVILNAKVNLKNANMYIRETINVKQNILCIISGEWFTLKKRGIGGKK